MKKLIIIMGAQGSSKSYYRRMKYSQYPQFDIMAFQHFLTPTRELVENSYVELLNAIKFALTKDDIVVMEHTLPFKSSREWYYKSLKNIFPSLQIELICMLPGLYRSSLNLKLKYGDKRTIYECAKLSLDILKYQEIPKKDETDIVRYVSIFYHDFYE